MGFRAVYKLWYGIAVLITFLLAAFTAVGAFSQFCHPQNHPFVTIAGMLLPGMLLLDFVIALYWIFRKKYWFLFPIFAIIVNYNYLLSVIQISSERDYKQKILTVASFNVKGFNREITGYTVKKIARYLDEKKVDIVCLQEIFWNDRFKKDSVFRAFNAYPYKLSPVGISGRPRIAIFSKYPIISSYFLPFPNSENCGMWADIRLNNEIVRIYNVHMQTTSFNSERAKFVRESRIDGFEGEEQAVYEMKQTLVSNFVKRAVQADVISRSIAKSVYPIIVCGDFNDTPASYTYHRIKGKLKDSFRETGKGYGYTYRGIGRLLRIDYILYSPTMVGISYYSPSFNWSDHNMVISQISLSE
ncbi:endonuclease/exonuclease/phosphatase family protein [Coprobacter tertius]|uniref:Endonuclease/exonuclease/phosphatase family protein n=1 Tax=Coprobacter tertius TaxID=2944915 RepID=A0ABT1MFY9_9BACT|nr:endonuclease/exonuclease/phosphatase family protein [Coprobacter tertius]MCP9610944.1 endonuclease/exonuclease/phosphatase family protein [Coprobacter tertius]